MKKILITLPLIVIVIVLGACGGSGYGRSGGTPPPVNGGGGSYTNASLSGTWVFTAHGSGNTSDFAVLGIFTTDGAGNITSGSQDVNDSSAGYKASTPITTGTYSVNSDGRGQVQLRPNSGSSVVFRFVLTSSGKARLFEVSGLEDATGQMFKQDSTAIANLSGTYVLRLDGFFGGNIDSVVGQLVATGGPTSGTLAVTFDENYSGSVTAQQPGSGTFNMTTNGRGTASLNGAAGTFSLVYYIVNSGHIEILETDTNAVLAGGADLQSGTFSTAINGPFVFSVAGLQNTGGGFVGSIREVGHIQLDGSGNITAGVEDYNVGGSYSQGVTFTGTYTVAASGRLTMHFVYPSFTADYVGWLSTPQSGVLLTDDTTTVESGSMLQQTVTPTNATLNGNYGVAFAGPNYTNNYNVEFTAALAFDGTGNISGTQDFQAGGVLVPNTALTGSYFIDNTGIAAGNLGGLPFRLYIANSSNAYFIAADSGRGYSGVVVLQQ